MKNLFAFRWVSGTFSALSSLDHPDAFFFVALSYVGLAVFAATVVLL